MRGLRWPELFKMSDRGGCGKRPDHAGGMPPFVVHGIGLAAIQFGPDFVADKVGSQKLCVGRSHGFASAEQGANQHDAGMPVERHVVVIKRVRRHRIDERRVLRA